MSSPVLSRVSSYLLSLVRVVAAFGFMTHGTQKLFGVPSIQAINTVELMSQRGVAGVIETFGGTLLLLGLFTRPVAFLCSGLMASAYFIAHAPRNFWPILNGGELAAVYCFLFLYFALVCGGALSLDALVSRRGRH